jgi:hypothetical protein
MRKNYDFSQARRGAVVQQPTKTRVSVHLDNELLERLRERADAAGRGFQAMISEALRDYLGRSAQPVDVETIRRIVREELRRVGRSGRSQRAFDQGQARQPGGES